MTLNIQQARVFGWSLFVDTSDTVVGRDILSAGCHERLESSVIMRLVKPGWIAVDVGAHVGYYTVMLSRLVGPEGKVYAFEPAAYNYAVLMLNLVTNKTPNVVPERRALSSKRGRVPLFLNPENQGDHSIFETPGREAVMVEAAALDDYSMIERVDFIKIDVQGAETEVLLGMSRLLRANPGVVLMVEVFPPGLVKAGTSAKALLALLSGLGFKFFLPSSAAENRGTLQEISAENLLKFERRSYENVFVSRGDMV